MTPIFSRTSADAIGKTLNVLVETIASEASAAGIVYSPKLSPLGRLKDCSLAILNLRTFRDLLKSWT
jgi:hypothetical protein